MTSVVVTGSLFHDNVNVEDTELMSRRLEYLENEMTVPPDNIKSIIDKTADYVKKNGKQFEEKIFKEKKNQFSFIHSEDPYFFYYQYKLHQLFLGVQPKLIIPKVVKQLKKIEELNARNTNEHVLKICDIVRDNKKIDKQENQKYIYSITDDVKEDNDKSKSENEEKIEIIENMFTVLCPFLGSTDIEVIKTTALFVARNGNNFLQELIEREKYNSQYDFLRANNLYFNFFSQLIEAYLKCFIPEEVITKKIKKYAKNKTDVLKYCYNLHLHNMEKKKEEERLIEEGRQTNAVYDWTNFVIVEQIDFVIGDEETLPFSINFSSVENYIVDQLYETNNSSNDVSKLSSLVYHMNKTEKELEEVVEEAEGQDRQKIKKGGLGEKGKGIVDAAYEEVDVLEEKQPEKLQKEKEKEKEKEREKVKEMEKNQKREIEKKSEVEKEMEKKKEKEKKKDQEKQKDKQKQKEKEKISVIETNGTVKHEKEQLLVKQEEGENEDEEEEEEEEEEKIVIVRNYEKTRKHKMNKENIHLCPITNKPIDINDMTKHLKTLLLDPKWKEQKDKLFEKAKKETSFEPLEDIEGNLSQFVINRPDLFGSIDEEINEHSYNEKKNAKISNKKEGEYNNINGEQDVYSYIHDIYNQMLYNPSVYNEMKHEDPSEMRYTKKQKS